MFYLYLHIIVAMVFMLISICAQALDITMNVFIHVYYKSNKLILYSL